MTKRDVVSSDAGAEFMVNLYHLCHRFSAGAGTMTPQMRIANNPPSFIRSPEAEAKLKAEMASCRAPCCRPKEST